MRALAVMTAVFVLMEPHNGVLRAEDASMTTMRFIVVKPAEAERPQSKPYPAITVTPPAAYADPGFDTFRAKIAAVAKRQIYAELAELVTPQGFFWDRDFAGEFLPRLPAVDNLAAALRLEGNNGAGWDRLAGFASESSAAPLPGRPGIVCSPAEATFDTIAFARLLDETASVPEDWAYPVAESTPVYAEPDGEAHVIEVMPRVVVRRLDRESARSIDAADSGTDGWRQVATPAGRIGYVQAHALRPLAPRRLCFGRDVFGRWHIAGYVGGE
jgi:hypothetical protein